MTDRLMERILYHIAIIAGILTIVSCAGLNTEPVFDDADAFIEFAQNSISVSEDGKQARIPVTLSSLSGLEERISYAVVEGSAREGQDYELNDGSAVLQFDAEHRTRDIVIDILEHSGEYTGDLDFSVVLKTSGSVNMGMKTSCSVTITDNDHPLASILGEYSASALDYFSVTRNWAVNITKDAVDPAVVHIDAIIFGCDSSGSWSVSGKVSDDRQTITISAGQTCAEYEDGPTDLFKLCTWEDGIFYYDSEDVVLKQESPGTWVCEQNIWFISSESEVLYGDLGIRKPLTLIKNKRTGRWKSIGYCSP